MHACICTIWTSAVQRCNFWAQYLVLNRLKDTGRRVSECMPLVNPDCALVFTQALCRGRTVEEAVEVLMVSSDDEDDEPNQAPQQAAPARQSDSASISLQKHILQVIARHPQNSDGV